MERTLENVHVVIYSKKMLKEAIKRLNNHGQNIETDIMCDYEFHGNDLLIYHDGLFKVIQCLPTHPNHEVTLNDLCEMIIDEESNLKSMEVGKWYTYQPNKTMFHVVSIDKSVFAYGIDFEGNWNKVCNLMGIDEIGNSDIREATKEEIENALVEEAVKRGFSKGVSFNSPNGKYTYTAINNKFEFIIDDPTYQRLMIGDHAIMVNGKWAEIIPEEKLKIDDWVFVQLKGNEHLGFSVQKLIFEHSVKYYNSPNCPHSAIKIDKETADRLRKELL
ncbi:hypothetical protein [Sphingobacterium sp.]|uniref:hypothetical protein n=1 Tax=Sphingobacterium sp. TaxID=341027 RepID=UPI0028AB2AD4|nr:hypothetical protein [Sphingobacterium sp.]